MVKNIPTIERSTKIRFGKHATDDQAENTIVFNASNVAIDASTAGGVYVTPMRTVDPSTPEITVLSYNTITKEIVNSDTASADLFNSNLQFVSNNGNVTSNTLQFTNPTTAFITTGGIGIGSSVLIDSSAANQIQVSGTTKTGALHTDKIGIANTSPTHALSLGNEGQLRLNVPTGSIYALETVGNVSAQNYIGDGGLLSNVTLQTVTDKSNVTSNTLLLTNPTTSLKAYSNVIVDGKITVGTPIETTSGGTGHDTYIPGTILYGTDTGTSLGRLVPAVSNQDAGKFLRLDASDIPEWAEVPLTLDAVLGDTTAISDGSMDLTGLGTTITTAGKIKAASFEGVGSELDGINAANVAPLSGTFTTSVLPVVPVTKGGTGLTTVAQNDLLLGPSSGDALAKLSAYTGPTSITAPPSGMSSTTQTIGGIQYTSSASSTMSGTTTYNAFDYNNTTIWRSGLLNDYSDMDGYYGGSTTTGSYSGEWIQIYRATAIAPTSIQIIPAQTTHAAPNVWKVFGSTNGSSWTEIHSSTTAVTWNSGNGHTATISGSAAYNYLRLAVQMSTIPNSLGTIAVSEVRFSAQGTGPTEKFLRSSAAGVSWDAVSSTLQTITDGGASTTNEISFTNGVTSLTASGNVVVTGNVTASTFKSTTLTSGKIPYTNANKELIDGPIGHDSTTNNTFVSSNLYVTGNLTVQGTTTFQDSNIHTVSDPIIEIGNANAIDTIDMGIIMTRPTANVVAGYMGDEKKYVIAYTLTDPDGAHIVPTNATSDQFMTLSVEGGNVLAGNVTTTGLVEAATLKGDGSAITSLDAEKITTGAVDVDHGGTNIASYTAGDLLYATGATTLAKLGVDNGKFLKSTASAVEWADVSSTLQAITDGGVTTTHTIAFNNTTTGLTSAGDIDIAATKQIDYAGDVLLKSSAGTVASLKVDNAIKLDPAYAAPSNNVLSFNTTTGEIYDSGGQGGSTLDNIHEEGSNVAIGPSVASANLTVNTYGSNVLTVSGNVSADSITIGNLNVAASPFALDDVVSVNAGANVTANVLTLGGLVTSGNVDASNIIVSGNTTSQNIKLTNTDISATISSGTITIDAREKSYGTAPLVVSTTDVSNLVFSNLITGAQIVVPILASGGDINISKELTNVNFYAMTTDVSVTQDKHALMTLSNLYGNIYMNAIGFS